MSAPASQAQAEPFEPAEHFSREPNRLLPIANVFRIMRDEMPKSAKVAKDAKEVMQECVSEFIGFIASESSDCMRSEARKTIAGDDILLALQNLGFDAFLEPLTEYLNKYRQVAGKGTRPPKSKAAKRHSAERDDEETEEDENFEEFDEAEEADGASAGGSASVAEPAPKVSKPAVVQLPAKLVPIAGAKTPIAAASSSSTFPAAPSLLPPGVSSLMLMAHARLLKAASKQ